MAIDFPTSPSTGAIYSYGGRSWTYNGTVWLAATGGGVGPQGPEGPTGPTGPNGEITWTPPTTSTFTSNRPDTGTITNISGGRGVRITAPGTTSDSPSLHYAMMTPTSGAGGLYAIARLRRHHPLANVAHLGIVIKQSDGNYQMIGPSGYNGVGLARSAWSSTTAISTRSYLYPYDDADLWMRYRQVSAGYRLWDVSKDGDAWTRFELEAFVGTSTSEIGIGLNPNSYNSGSLQSNDHFIDCLSWEQGAIA